MTSIPIIEAGFAYLFTDYFKRAGFPVSEWLQKECLPQLLLKQADGYVSEYHLRKFIEHAVQQSGINDAGLKIVEDASIETLGDLGQQMKAAATLVDGLSLFCQSISGVNSHARFWLSQHEGNVWFCRDNPEELDLAKHYAEQFTIMYMTKLVQFYTGENWFPEQAWLKTADKYGYTKHHLFKKSKIKYNRSFSAIMLPVDDGKDIKLPKQLIPPTPQPEKLVTTLKVILKPYFQEASPSVELAAKLSRLSVRTFKRRLLDEGISFRELVSQLRYEMACSLLKDTQLNMLEVANALAYKHPGNFTRAFSQWSGMTPQEYRKKMARQ